MILLPIDYWEIKETKRKGRGVFAKKDISKGTVIGDYLGKILRPENAIVDEKNFYLMYYHDRAVISPDLEKSGVHLLNHSCVPNCWLYIYRGHILAFALRKILIWEELTIPYLLPPIDKFCNPCLHVCHCGNIDCSKTMHLSIDKFKLWRKLTSKQSKETKRERIRYGKDLPALSEYPKKISGDYIKEIKKLLAEAGVKRQ